MTGKYIIALDQGTTSSRAVLFDNTGGIVDLEQQEFAQIYPQPGWVEHDPEEIWKSQRRVLSSVLSRAVEDCDEIAAIGISNQRETTVVWDKISGEPVYNAIVWQCRRTASVCDELRSREGFAAYVKQSTGLLLDPYFSATKIKWILEA